MKRGISENVAAPAAIPARVASADGWCILRTSGPRTLPLTRSLSASGFEVWTPVQTGTRRKPRRQVIAEFEAPIVPTFVFARADRVTDLLGVAASPVNPHPPFSVFHHRGRVPLIADCEIEGLRRYEQRCNEIAQRDRVKAHRKAFAVGERVSVTAEAWQGLSGIVEGGDGKQARVSFGGSLSVTIATFFLVSNEVEDTQLYSGTTAKAASAR